MRRLPPLDASFQDDLRQLLSMARNGQTARLPVFNGQVVQPSYARLATALNGGTATATVAAASAADVARVMLTNRVFDRWLGLEPGESTGRRREDVLPEDLRHELATDHRRVLAGETITEEQLFEGGGESRRVSIVKFPLTDQNGEVDGVCGVATDISNVRRMQTQIEQLSDHDPLTGLYNRRRLMSELEGHLHYALRHSRCGALVLLDIDNFKLVNDSYGHAGGDRQLTAVARVLRDRVRETDTVARLGSDEFAIVLAEVNEQQALRVTSQIRALLIERPIGPPIQLSAGIAIFDGERGQTAGDLLVDADAALFEAKQAGGGRAHVYRGQSSSTLTWVQRIRNALDEGRFVLYSQPIVDPRTGKISHREL